MLRCYNVVVCINVSEFHSALYELKCRLIAFVKTVWQFMQDSLHIDCAIEIEYQPNKSRITLWKKNFVYFSACSFPSVTLCTLFFSSFHFILTNLCARIDCKHTHTHFACNFILCNQRVVLRLFVSRAQNEQNEKRKIVSECFCCSYDSAMSLSELKQ